VLVDAAGSIFVAGSGRVTQLNAEGQHDFSQPTDITSPVAAAVLVGGTRVALTSEGQLRAWTTKGEARFSVDLPSQNRWINAGLLPLPNGGLLVSGGLGLFDVDADGHVRAHAKLESAVQQTLVVNARSLVVDDRGEIHEWDGFEAVSLRASFPGRVAVVGASGSSSLVGLLPSGSSLVEVSLATGVSSELARVPEPGLLPLLSIVARGQLDAVRRDGSRFSLGRELPAGAQGSSVADFTRGAELLGSPAGTLAWLAADRALRLSDATGQERELAEVRCREPASLVSAGAGRLIAACRSGELWLIGPQLRTVAPAEPPASNRNTPPGQLSPS
jgi:hypothetical protein